jgi:uncharacterized protein (DUF1778 family)
MSTVTAPYLDATAPAKTDRLNIRATAYEKALVELAARVSRVTTSQFVLQAAMRSAEDVLADQTRFELPEEKWLAFEEALDRPARVVPALARAIAASDPFCGE